MDLHIISRHHANGTHHGSLKHHTCEDPKVAAKYPQVCYCRAGGKGMASTGLWGRKKWCRSDSNLCMRYGIASPSGSSRLRTSKL